MRTGTVGGLVHGAHFSIVGAAVSIMASLVPPGIRHERGSSRKSGSTLQKIAQKKEQLRHYPRIKKLERIATHLRCEVRLLARHLVFLWGYYI